MTRRLVGLGLALGIAGCFTEDPVGDGGDDAASGSGSGSDSGGGGTATMASATAADDGAGSGATSTPVTDGPTSDPGTGAGTGDTTSGGPMACPGGCDDDDVCTVDRCVEGECTHQPPPVLLRVFMDDKMTTRVAVPDGMPPPVGAAVQTPLRFRIFADEDLAPPDAVPLFLRHNGGGTDGTDHDFLLTTQATKGDPVYMTVGDGPLGLAIASNVLPLYPGTIALRRFRDVGETNHHWFVVGDELPPAGWLDEGTTAWACPEVDG